MPGKMVRSAPLDCHWIADVTASRPRVSCGEGRKKANIYASSEGILEISAAFS